jgi:hypothetical protein
MIVILNGFEKRMLAQRLQEQVGLSRDQAHRCVDVTALWFGSSSGRLDVALDSMRSRKAPAKPKQRFENEVDFL